MKKSIKFSKIVKNGPEIVKNENFQKKIFFCSFYVIMSLHAKNCVCRSNGLACGQYKDKEGKNNQKSIGHEKANFQFFLFCLKDHQSIPKNKIP